MKRKRMVIALGCFVLLMGVAVWWNNRLPAPICKGCYVIVISLDQVRAKSLPCFGYAQNTTPNLCSFAATSYMYTNAYTTASRTHDAHFSMITGLYPSLHTMTMPYVSTLPNNIPTLAERLKMQGYQTYFFGPVGDPHLPLTKGLERGFDKTFDADTPSAWAESMESIATQSGTSHAPKFFFMHTYDAHEPYIPDAKELSLFYDGPVRKQMSFNDLCRFTYTKLVSIHPQIQSDKEVALEDYCAAIFAYQEKYAKSFDEYNDTFSIFNDEYWQQFDDLPPEEKARYTHALYIAQLHSLDASLGRFFTYLTKNNLLKNTVVIIVGDQGDEFFEHNSYSHGWSLYNEVMHVPFIVYVPGGGFGRSNKLVSIVDIVPTVLEVVGVSRDVVTSGLSVFSSKMHDMIIAEHVSDKALKLQTDRYSLIQRVEEGAVKTELFDRQKDPDEQHNIVADHNDIVEKMRTDYSAMKSYAPVRSNEIKSPFPTWMNDEDKKDLIETGYF